MLKQRIITGTLLAIVAICAVIFLPQMAFLIISAAFILLAAWEWTLIMQVTVPLQRLFYLLLVAVFMYLSYRYFPITILLLISVVWWIVGLVLAIFYPRLSGCWNKCAWSGAIIGLLLLIPGWLSINVIRMAVNGPLILLFMLVVIWASDIGAYFVGRKWGKTKLLPRVSPGKSWQGLGGGVILSLLVAVLGCWLLKLPLNSYAFVLAICLVMVLFGVVGDLVESMFKRQAGVKDSGAWLPGHGGILDRIDSLLAAAPVFLLCTFLLSFN